MFEYIVIQTKYYVRNSLQYAEITEFSLNTHYT